MDELALIEPPMARPTRIEFAGAVYHVITRGNNRQQVFKDDMRFGTSIRIVADGGLSQIRRTFTPKINFQTWIWHSRSMWACA